MQSFVKIKPSQNGKIDLSFTDIVNHALVLNFNIANMSFFFVCVFHLYTLFSPSSDMQRVGEGHPSACLTNYSKGILFVDCISSSPLSCTFHAISKAVLKQSKQPARHHSVVWFYLSKGFL